MRNAFTVALLSSALLLAGCTGDEILSDLTVAGKVVTAVSCLVSQGSGAALNNQRANNGSGQTVTSEIFTASGLACSAIGGIVNGTKTVAPSQVTPVSM